MGSYRDLIVWKKGIDLCEIIYQYTENFPKSELYGLTSQIRRCAVSIPSNIAEGQRRSSKKEFIQFLRIAYASGAELETQLLIAKRLSFINTKDFDECNQLLEEIMKMINKLMRTL